ncbi:Hsp20/alpha crystallin family protein [Bacillus testis]|uniref:Hsp20/alpha crystallin family protein n=1 Tax=Bacillus testis TaxID=1622072 RepID=UPI00067E9E0A|nr:Hsp20/alpha crystallin family protein [Bacillus testis]
MQNEEQKKRPSSLQKKNPEILSDFVLNMDQLFSGKPLGNILQSMDGFFQNSKLNRSFPIEMIEESHAYIVRAKLPGISRQRINIEVINQSLHIVVRHEESLEQKNTLGETIRSQKAYQHIQRNITFVKPINDQGITAEHKDGLLEITVPKVKGKEIRISQ